MADIAFQDKFIGFVDILGFKKLVQAAEAGTGLTLVELQKRLDLLGSPKDEETFKKQGPAMCPCSTYVQRDLNFRLTRVSDCVVVSAEVSPAGVVNLVSHCWTAVLELLGTGLMCRGYITRGKIYHEGTEVIGSGYQEAQTKESGVSAFKRDANELGTPFVEVDRTVTEYVRDHGDGCVKEMFSRQIQSDGVVTAIFPFKRLAHRFLVRPDLDPAKEKRANENVRRRLQEFKLRVSATVDRTNARAVSKMEHYIAALDAQLEICAKTDEFIDKLNTLIPRNRPELK